MTGVASFVELYVSLLNIALPICIVFHLGNRIVTSFITVAFGGEMRF